MLDKPTAAAEAQRKIQELPKICAAELGLPAAIVIGVNDLGDLIVNSHGLNHLLTVQSLAVAIHAVMSDHDKAVLAGVAGPVAQERFEMFGQGDFDAFMQPPGE